MCTNFQHYRTKNAKIEKIAQIGAKIPKNTQKRPQNQKLIKHTSFIWPNEDTCTNFQQNCSKNVKIEKKAQFWRQNCPKMTKNDP